MLPVFAAACNWLRNLMLPGWRQNCLWFDVEWMLSLFFVLYVVAFVQARFFPLIVKIFISNKPSMNTNFDSNFLVTHSLPQFYHLIIKTTIVTRWHYYTNISWRAVPHFYLTSKVFYENVCFPDIVTWVSQIILWRCNIITSSFIVIICRPAECA